MRLLHRCATIFCALLFSACNLSAQEGATLYKKSCASCHDANIERVPSRDVLQAMSPEHVLEVMESGAMVPMSSRLSAAERRAVAEFVAGKSFGHMLQTAPPPQAMCAAATADFTEPLPGPLWNGWGANLTNSRLFWNEWRGRRDSNSRPLP
jgi:polyvinyl alcohol dehydrogenase (cytochrome)